MTGIRISISWPWIAAIIMAVLVYCSLRCSNSTDQPAEDKTGACSHIQTSTNYSNAACTGSILVTSTKTYCTETSDYTSCKLVTSCTNGFSYSDAQFGIQGKTCAQAGYPLACANPNNKVSALGNCP